MNKNHFFLLLLLSVCSLTTGAQNIVGTWKRTANIIENADGTRKDMQPLFLKSKPCMADIKYIFEAGGKHYMQSPKGCGINSDADRFSWKMNGNTITVTSNGGKPGPVTATYTLVFTGNAVTFTHVYNDAEKSSYHITAKKIIITYQRI
jgi:hypothetical protein